MKAYNSALITKRMKPSVSQPVLLDSDTEIYQVPTKGTELETRALTLDEVNICFPRVEIETDLQALLRAGVHPQEVNVTNLLTPTSVDYLSDKADYQAGKVILQYENAIRESVPRETNTVNSQNTNQNEQQE